MRIAPTGGSAALSPCVAAAALLALSAPAPSRADRVTVEIEGLEGDMLESARASVALKQYEERDTPAIEVRRLFERADEEIRLALEPFGYYSASVASNLEQPEPAVHRAVFRVTPGEPVIVTEARVEVSGEAAQLDSVKQAIEAFRPKVDERLDHGAYERSKQQIETALANEGFMDAKLLQRRIAVVRAARTAEINLEWDAGRRYRFGPVRYAAAQFPQEFMQRYTPWKEGEYYSADKLLGLQQTLVDADYFSSVGVTPDLERAQHAVVPIDVLLVPAKRTLYTGSVYVSTDSGPGGRLGVQRRWINARGHKLGGEIEYSRRLEQIGVNYRVPKPGLRNRYVNFGAGYVDEETDTSRSHMARLAATEVTERWRGFTRTLGLQYLNGTFEIADQQQDTSLLFADGLLTRKRADDLYFPLSGYSLLYGLRFAYEPFLSDTSFVQVRAEA
ncbi:MAG TPA: POTRA domain-containing protein, partial [Steroidobacter sp.]|nr:POTRA domain-containing protein [Steroidobacter sp.]